MEKSQKEYYLNEQLKAIQKELGEIEEGKDETKILEDSIAQIEVLNEKEFLIYNLLNGLILAMKDYIEKNSIKKLFLGLSGGIDSAVVLFIASKVISREKITAIMMPSEFTSDVSLKDAKKLASNLGVNYKIISIQKHIKNFEVTFKKDFEGLEKDITEQNISYTGSESSSN